MKVVIIAENYRCVGSCKTVFDDEGNCVVRELPWTNVNDFALADGMADYMTKGEFHRYVTADPFVEAEIDGHEVQYLQSDSVYMIYDVDTNRHYFFA